MDKEKILHIRREEKKYHESLFENHTLQLHVKPLSFDITQNNRFIHIKTNAITFIAYNNKLESL